MPRLDFDHYLVEVWSETNGRWELWLSTSKLAEAQQTYDSLKDSRVRLVKVLATEFGG